MLRKDFGELRRMKRILSMERDVPDLEQSITFVNNLQGQLPTDLEIESIPLQDFCNIAEQVHVATREAATNTDLNMREFFCNFFANL